MAFLQNPAHDSNPTPAKKKRSLPGTPDPEAEVIGLSPKTLMATNRFLCEICGKGFQRDQNLQLHRRGHNLPWKLRQRSGNEPPRKRVYVCPEKGCVHSDPSRALGDLTGIKKHFCRKHGEKKWKCDKCEKRYAVQSDWKAHSKTCGTREYRCDCGTIFSRRDSFITHRAFCDALAEETARMAAASRNNDTFGSSINSFNYHSNGGLIRTSVGDQAIPGLSLWMGQGPNQIEQTNADPFVSMMQINAQQFDNYGNKLSSPISSDITSLSLPSSTAKEVDSFYSLLESVPSLYSTQHQQLPVPAPPDMSATALLQKAALMGVTSSVPTFARNFDTYNSDGLFQKDDMGGETRDFLGIGACTSSINGWIESIQTNKFI